jgi:hypothetical protein
LYGCSEPVSSAISEFFKIFFISLFFPREVDPDSAKRLEAAPCLRQTGSSGRSSQETVLRNGDTTCIGPALAASGANTPWELYDLAKDRAEAHDLAAQHPEKVTELAAIWARHDEEFCKQGATGMPAPPQRPRPFGESKE